MAHRLLRSAFLTAVVAALLCAPGATAKPATPGVLHVGFPLSSAFPGDLVWSPPVVSDVGDIDGDRLEDTAVSVPTDDGTSTIWVTFAGAAPSSVEAGGPGWRGFAIVGAYGAELDGITGVGDTNGDGIGDVAVTTSEDTTRVVYGRRDGGTVDLRSLGTGGFTIAHAEATHGGFDGETTIGYARVGGVTAVGDQDGDGRADVAVFSQPEGGGASHLAVVRSPAAGATVDAQEPSDDVFTFSWTLSHGGGFADTLGDLDGDGRQDLAVAWSDPDGVRVAGVISPAPGTDVALEDVAADHRGFLYASDADYDFGGMATVGDQNGDGHRDIEVMAGRIGREVSVLPSLPAGGEGTFTPGLAGMHGDAILAIGDQDGDGREDVTEMSAIHYAKGDESWAVGIAGALLVGSVADRNGDGRRELLGLHADPFNDPIWSNVGVATAKYQLDTYFGLPTPCCPAPQPQPGPQPAPAPVVVRPAAVRHVGKRLTGTKKNDRLTGTAYADVIKGLGGNDTIKAFGGNDTIDGGAGRDRVDAGAGNDAIRARDGQIDTIECGAGKDSVVADRADRVRHCEKVSQPKAKPRKKRR